LVATSSSAAVRTYVASYGSDGNAALNCSPTMPCRTLGVAMGATDSGGEVVVLNSAGYGRVTINKSISLIAPAGIYAGLVASSGQNAVDISGSGINVVLKGLTLLGQGGIHGVSMASGQSLTIENCEVSGFTGTGISVGGGADARILDTVVKDNQVGIRMTGGGRGAISRTRVLGSTGNGIEVDGTSASATVTIDRTTVDGAGGLQGILAKIVYGSGATVRVAVSSSMIANNVKGVVASVDGNGNQVAVDISRSTIAGNSGAGVFTTGSSGAAVISLTRSLVSGNGVGLYNDYGTLGSAGNNTVTDNGTNTVGTVTAPELILAQAAVCGNTAPTVSAPTATCNAGTASSGVITAADAYQWTCAGPNGGGSATCVAPRQYVVSATAGANGMVSPSAQTVAFGSTATFSTVPHMGYSAYVYGTCPLGSPPGDSTYTTGPITENCMLNVGFSAGSSCPAAPANYFVAQPGGTVLGQVWTPYDPAATFVVAIPSGTGVALGFDASRMRASYPFGFRLQDAVGGAKAYSVTVCPGSSTPVLNQDGTTDVNGDGRNDRCNVLGLIARYVDTSGATNLYYSSSNLALQTTCFLPTTVSLGSPEPAMYFINIRNVSATTTAVQLKALLQFN
jgi:hypothetical protein